MSFELHAHLYGCLTLRDLVCLSRREGLRYDFFNRSFASTYGQTIDLKKILEAKDWLKLARCYYFRKPGNFQAFQTGFDLVIALSRSDESEFHQVVQSVQERQSAALAEYRQLFSPLLTPDEWAQKVESLAGAMRDASHRHPQKQMRLAMSLLREGNAADWQYRVLKQLQESSPAVREMLVAVDFCATEEGFPPGAREELFALIHKDNARDPSRALAILYHVGESFTDKSVESAARWVFEAARLGVHRLGHALALGILPEHFQGNVREEIASERIAQIDFECQHAEALCAGGYAVDTVALQAEKKDLHNGPEKIKIIYDKGRLHRLELFQDFCIQGVRQTGAVIESCPTSNLRIGSLSPGVHPLRRFLNAGLSVVIGSDDPGILRTNLEAEFRLVRKFGLTEGDVERLRACARKSTSAILSGRSAA